RWRRTSAVERAAREANASVTIPPPYEPDDDPEAFQPPAWRVSRYGHPADEPGDAPAAPLSEPFAPPDEPADAAEPTPAAPDRERAAGANPAFGFIVAMALSVGLMPLAPENTDVRYIVFWGVLALFGVSAWLFGRMSRIEDETPQD